MRQVLGYLQHHNGSVTRQTQGVNPTSSRSTSADNNNGVGVKADTLCSTGANVKVNPIEEALWTTDQQSHPGDYEPWTCK